jgi:hypothetical protein
MPFLKSRKLVSRAYQQGHPGQQATEREIPEERLARLALPSPRIVEEACEIIQEGF